mmetsp:Transcript_48378/g.87503  ORF Transcript_48378/g.87503 Transcript_48378/m.87503 type:complete len:249 (-) Transcript_48378:430-1176(-)
MAALVFLPQLGRLPSIFCWRILVSFIILFFFSISSSPFFLWRRFPEDATRDFVADAAARHTALLQSPSTAGTFNISPNQHSVHVLLFHHLKVAKDEHENDHEDVDAQTNPKHPMRKYVVLLMYRVAWFTFLSWRAGIAWSTLFARRSEVPGRTIWTTSPCFTDRTRRTWRSVFVVMPGRACIVAHAELETVFVGCRARSRITRRARRPWWSGRSRRSVVELSCSGFHCQHMRVRSSTFWMHASIINCG